MNFRNETQLDSHTLERLFREFAVPWPLDGLDVRVRYTRSTPFSGLCSYNTGRINVNIGRKNAYPFPIYTHIARARSTARGWWRPYYAVPAADGYQLATFIFMHELYHWLVKKARRNTRQKESRCDRFAARALVDGFGAVVTDPQGGAVARETWDFQDLDGFVAAALTAPTRRPRIRVKSATPISATPTVTVPAAAAKAAIRPRAKTSPGTQLELF
jgi:hypothetical protein